MKKKKPIFDAIYNRPRVIIIAWDEQEAGTPMVELNINGEVHSLIPEYAMRIAGALQEAAYEAAK